MCGAECAGRSVRGGANILALQLLPHLLRRRGRWGLAVFCDFRKAYDTIDRGFLLSALSSLGFGDAFLSLVRPLLSGTYARALVNGFISSPAGSNRARRGTKRGIDAANPPLP